MIRPMTEGDFEQIAMLELACFSEPWSFQLIREAYYNRMDYFFVLDEDKILGYACIRLIDFEGEIQRVAVFPEYQGRGIGKKLLETILDFSRENRVNEITLEVRSHNEIALKLYKTYGFRQEAVRKDYYRHPLDDAIIMWKRDV